MQQLNARPTGRGAGVIKYDVITALSVMSMHDGPKMQTTVLRLIALITARYNWKLDQFSVPQSDMARMWNVSERTVKREIKQLVASGLILCIRQGVRGRVGAYRLNYRQVSDVSRASWSCVGDDFADRMHGFGHPQDAKIVKVDFGTRDQTPPALPQGDDAWSAVLRSLAETDAPNLRNWYMKLSLVRVDGSKVILKAPSAFVAQFVQTHLAGQITRAFGVQLGRAIVLELVV